ncbi:Glucooligosaccharide oxidase [Amniculicola lignicola CBS 123094]|uniref:Glucooligosaccharide oxidase n=1 Tax=Amniculicola lignicola CBS 123094 TaxID=1392246 RepID=A0A6A5W770_9PLEO|nr:Glucooligosaccharide oxidase [Amniculicola lignicola CBS 123094]
MKYAIIIGGFLSTGLVQALAGPSPGECLEYILGSKNVPVKWINDPAYGDLTEPFNLRLQYKPIAIVIPTTNQHVQDAVVAAGKCGVKVQAKSGGHSYASFSSGGQDGSMMIDLQSFQEVTVDQNTGIATVGAGVRIGNLAQGIWDQGKRALPHGTCPGVGIGGHATHGGYGHASRNWGLSMDTIVGAEVVLADGSLVYASANQNFELYWAIRGAAESFGIITSFKFQTRNAPESVTYFQFQWSGLFKSKTDFVKTFLHIQDFATNGTVVDNRISFGIYMDGTVVSLGGAFFGSVEEFEQRVKPEFLRGVPAPVNVNVGSYSWYDYLVLVSDKDTIKEPLTGYDEHDHFFAKSVTVPEKDGLKENTFNQLWDYLSKGSPAPYFIITNLYGGPGSSINYKTEHFAAYADRDSLWVLQNYGDTENPANIDFINGINDVIIKSQPETTFGAYLNYVDPSYDAATAHKVYYGDAIYGKLLKLKQKYDPRKIFWNPQAIGA